MWSYGDTPHDALQAFVYTWGDKYGVEMPQEFAVVLPHTKSGPAHDTGAVSKRAKAGR
jgi:hypothetical protein